MELTKKDLVMTSREVAEITGKRHDYVLRSIREEIESLKSEGLEGQSIFVKSSYKNSQNKEQPQYLLSEQGIKLLAMRYKNLKNTNFQTWLIENNIIKDFIHTKTRFEVSFLNLLEEALLEIGIVGVRQHKVGTYRIDFYIPSFKIAIEYDEHQHRYTKDQDSIRQEFVTKELDCKFVRCDYEDSDIKNVMKVLKKIKFGGNN